MERIIKRVGELEEKLDLDEPPEREYFLRYPSELVEDLFNLALISKTKYDLHHKNSQESVGDMSCIFCPFTEYCYSEGVKTDISMDRPLQMRLHRLNEDESSDFIKTGNLPSD